MHKTPSACCQKNLNSPLLVVLHLLYISWYRREPTIPALPRLPFRLYCDHSFAVPSLNNIRRTVVLTWEPAIPDNTATWNFQIKNYTAGACNYNDTKPHTSWNFITFVLMLTKAFTIGYNINIYTNFFLNSGSSSSFSFSRPSCSLVSTGWGTKSSRVTASSLCCIFSRICWFRSIRSSFRLISATETGKSRKKSPWCLGLDFIYYLILTRNHPHLDFVHNPTVTSNVILQLDSCLRGSPAWPRGEVAGLN